jgi:hypothetical protein
MSAERVEQASRVLRTARARLDGTIGALQHRMKPANLAGEAWDGVKEKGADLAEGALDATRKHPAAVAALLGALGLFLAREPIRRGIGRLVSGEESDGEGEELITTRIETSSDRFNVLEPVSGDKVKLKEGVS